MNIEDITSTPKLFCESVQIGFTDEFFALALNAGDEPTVFALTPAHAKRLAQYLSHQVAEFEKNHQTIHAEWKPKIVSPVQRRNPPRAGS